MNIRTADAATPAVVAFLQQMNMPLLLVSITVISVTIVYHVYARRLDDPILRTQIWVMMVLPYYLILLVLLGLHLTGRFTGTL